MNFWHNYRLRLLSYALCGVFFFDIGIASAETSVWSVLSGNNTVYLGGTVHLLRPSDYPLPEEYEQAYQASSDIYFETDISAMSKLSVQTQMLQQLTYSDDRTLKSVLNEEAYTAIAEYAAGLGMPLMMLEKFKPGLLVSTFQVLEFQRMGFTPLGVDSHYNTKAINDGKPIGQLETVEEQIGFLAAMGEGNESEFILLSLRDIDQTEQLIEEMIQAWRTGNNQKLSEMFVEEMKEEAPELYDSLLLQRNLKWIPQIEQMLKDEDTEFVLVGAAHIVGENGLLELLSSKGYQIKQL
ncbi:MAG: TraB/GumN family protein [SAR86 cluster bacterium]|uniref:TraB/GumN family protein n=1 Tax=SAR86 cluster bacterium TaxID=2030880 RepID=A0A2A5BAM5_9GAMM|nr:MAG: TraB/GumN family protein [SAR86 cluster bacterium]